MAELIGSFFIFERSNEMKKNNNTFFSLDIVLVMIATLLFQFSVMSLNPLINGYAKSLGASNAFSGIIVGVMSITSMILRPVAGNLTDTLSKYQLTLIGGIICAISNIGYVIVSQPVLLFLLRIINGTGFVLCTVCMATWLAFLVPRNHVGEAMGYYGLLNATSMALAPALAISLYKIVGYREILVISAVAVILMVIVIQFIKNRAKPIVKATPRVHHFQILQKDALPVAVIVSLFSVPYFATQADIVEYVAQRNLHVTVSFYFLIYAVALFTIRIALKNYFDTVRFGVWFGTCSIATMVYILFLFAMNNNIEMTIAAIGMALGYGIMFSICQSTSLLLAPLEEQGLASSTFYLGLDIGMALGPIIGGLISELLSIKWYYPIMLILVPIAGVIFIINRRKLNNAIKQN